MDAVRELVKYDEVIIFDAYATENGFARYLESFLLDNSYKGKVVLKAVPNAFVKQASIEEQRREFGIDVESIIKLVK